MNYFSDMPQSRPRPALRRLLALALLAGMLLLIALPTPAKAATVVRPDGSPESPLMQKWLREIKVPTVPYDVQILREACPNRAERISCVRYEYRTIWLAPNDHGNTPSRLTFYHELAHLYDFGMQRSARTWFARLRNDHRRWDEERGDGTGVGASLQEQFASAYGACAYYGDRLPPHDRTHVFYYSYGESVTIRQHRRFCAYIKRTKWIGDHTYRGVLEGAAPWPA